MRRVFCTAAVFLAAVTALSCGGRDVGGQGGAGQVAARALHTGNDDVSGFSFSISCSNGWTLSPNPTYVPIHGTTSATSHDFADLFSTIPAPAHCTVTVIPMKDEKTPSEDCEPVTQQFDVTPYGTVELALLVQCAGPENGGADVNPQVNHPPVIVIAVPDKFPCAGQPAEIDVSTSDPDGDVVALHFEVGTWTVVAGVGTCVPPPPDPSWNVSNAPAGYPWYFVASVAGEFCMIVTADDGHGGVAAMSFPIHVQDCRCCEIEEKPGVFTYLFGLSADDCKKYNGHIVTDERCACCHSEKDRTYEILLDPRKCEPPPAFVIVPAALCARACCDYFSAQSHLLVFMPQGECTDRGGQVVPDDKCREHPIRFCCRVKDAMGGWDYSWTTGDCKGAIVPDVECTRDICCVRQFKDPHDPMVTYPVTAITSQVFCSEHNGQETGIDKCIPEVCCYKEGGGEFITTAEACAGPGLTIVQLEKCGRECCFFSQFGLNLTVMAGDCVALGGAMAADGKCTLVP